MSAEASVVIGVKHLIAALGSLLAILGVIIGSLWKKNDTKLDNLKEKVDTKHYTKEEVDDRIKLHIEPMVNELGRNTVETTELNKTMQHVNKQLAVLGERFGNK